jgi:general secretion pathway protein B
MSSILDALKKSERQRSLGRSLIFRNAKPHSAPRLTGFAIAVLVALLVLALAIGALLFSLREPEMSPPVSIPADKLPVVSGTSAVAENNANKSADPLPATPAGMARGLESKRRSSLEFAPLTAKPDLKRSDASLKATPVPEQPQLMAGTGEAVWLSTLPAAFRNSLPALTVNIHVYSPEASQRILYINNRPARQGERIEGGVVVEEIVVDGVVLQYRGQRFKLPRPS